VRVVIILFLLMGVALADDPQVPPPNPSTTAQVQALMRTVFDLNSWLRSLSLDLDRLEGGIYGLALALVMLGFVYGIVQGIMGGGLEALRGAFVRLAVAGLLLSLWNSGFVGRVVERSMTAAREWGTDSVVLTLSDAANNLEALALRVIPFMGAVGAVKMMTAKVAENAAKSAVTRSVASGTGAGAGKLLQYMNWATLLLIPLMLFFFILIVVASFTAQVGVTLFPLAAALLAFPKGAAADWFGKWVAAVMGALLIVILLPIGFRAAVDIGINRPVERVNAYVNQAMDQIEAMKEESMKAAEEAWEKCRVWDVGCDLSNNMKLLWARLNALLQKIGTAVQAWLLTVVLLLVGMAAAAYILFNIERVAMSFIGGFVATGVRGMLGTASLGGRMYTSGGVGRAAAAGAAGAAPSPSPEPIRLEPRPRVYDIQPYYGGGYRSGGEVIEGEWKVARELPNPPTRALPAPPSES
jgi:hypothetical protein